MSVLSHAERAAVAALADTIFPADATGPGASSFGVVEYIDQQLRTTWGDGTDWYSRGPHATPGHSGHGWQSALSPADLYHRVLAALDTWSRSRFGAPVAAIHADARRDVVAALEDGTLPVPDAAEFFQVLRRNVIDGLFRDPVFGGNRDYGGWRWLFGTAAPHHNALSTHEGDRS